MNPAHLQPVVEIPALSPPPSPWPTRPAAPICRSEDLLQGGRLQILHGGETYHLRLTKSGKLLLTK